MMGGLKKKRRIRLIALGGVLLIAATALMGYAFRDGIQYFRAPSQIAENPPGAGEVFKLGGLVADGSWQKDGELSTFTITDGGADIRVSYMGILPDLFREGQGTIVTGTYENAMFTATEVLAKHDESYLPKEVADALKEQGVFKPNGELN